MHAARIGVMNVAVTRQHPLKFITQKFFHRTSLFGPRIPSDAAKCRQRLPRRRPRQVIAREQKLVPVKKNDVTTSMSRRGNHEQLVVELNWFRAANYVLDAQPCGAVIGVHNALTAKFTAKQLVIGDVVFVREQHAADAAQRFDPFQELTRKPGRVDQQITAFACRTSDQVTPGTEARLRCEAAEVDVVVERHRKRVDADVRIVSFGGANRPGGARDERHHCASDFIGSFRLTMDAALVTVIAKDCGR